MIQENCKAFEFPFELRVAEICQCPRVLRWFRHIKKITSSPHQCEFPKSCEDFGHSHACQYPVFCRKFEHACEIRASSKSVFAKILRTKCRNDKVLLRTKRTFFRYRKMGYRWKGIDARMMNTLEKNILSQGKGLLRT